MTTEKEANKVISIDEPPLHVEELQDIITLPPAWLIRYGIGLLLTVILSIIAISVFIRYPEIIKNPVVVRSDNTSKPTIAGTTGQINILVQPKQLVKSGDVLACIENATDMHEAITLLNNLLIVRNQLFTNHPISDEFMKNIDVTKLGELNQAYQGFYLSYMSSREYIFTKTWSKLSFFTQNLNTLIADLQGWKRKYVSIATQSGEVHFVHKLRNQQIVNAGQELFYCTSGPSEYYGEMLIPETNIKKIKIGQKVIVKVNELPYEKYGSIEGRVSAISELPLSNGAYDVIVRFLISKKGSIDKEKLRSGMIANAEITTQNITLFSKMMENLFKKTANKL